MRGKRSAATANETHPRVAVLERDRAPRAVVPDTSVVLKWFLDEPDRQRALALRAAHGEGVLTLLFLELLLYEVANVLRFKPGWSAAHVATAVDALYALEVETRVASPALLARASHLAVDYDVSVYDAAFIALAQEEDAAYVTADERVARRAKSLTCVHSLRTYRVAESS